MKAVAHRSRNLADIESLVEVHSTLDVDCILRWVQDFVEVLEMPEILSDLRSILNRHPAI